MPSATAERACRRRSRCRRRSAVELGGTAPPCSLDPAAHRVGGALADATRPSVKSTPLMRVWAVNGTSSAPCRSRSREAVAAPWRARRSSDPRASRRPGSRAARPRPARRSVTPRHGTNSAACRLPRVMVPVLSSSSVEQSPAASTARPDMASTLRCTRRSMPAMPMADSRRADRGRDQADQQGDQHDDRTARRRE